MEDDYASHSATIQKWSPIEVIEHIESVDLFDWKFIAWCQTVKEKLEPDLINIMQERSGNEQLQASLLLVHLGNSIGTKGIISCLQSLDINFQNSVLLKTSLLPLSNLGSQAPVPIEKQALVEALQPFLQLDSSSQFSEYTQELAVRIVMLLDVPEAAEIVSPLLRISPISVKATILHFFARKGEDHGALEVAKELIEIESRVHATVGSLEAYCKGENIDLSRRASNILVDFVLKNYRQQGNDFANHLWHAMDGLVEAEHPDIKRILEQVLHGPVIDFRRGIALRHLAPLDEDAGVSRLTRALQDSNLRQYASESISAIGAVGDNSALSVALLNAIEQEQRERVLAKLVNAYVAVGAELTTMQKPVLERLDPGTRMHLKWLTSGITPQYAANLMVQAEVVPSVSEDTLKDLEAHWTKDWSAFRVVREILDRQMAWFDTESGISPPDYLDLLAHLLTISDPIFQATDFEQTVNEDNGESLVRYRYMNNEYSFLARNFGDFYDVASVLQGLNQALADAGAGERFMLLYTGDQTTCVIFVPRDSFITVAQQLDLPLESDEDAGQKQGRAFEDVVFRTLLQENQPGKRSLISRLVRWILTTFWGNNREQH
ncbi:MAG: hypothetical protein KDE09_18915 [Anaerolineales bacterium]|nr:hypothetical protein [Anaerolineales bacterium]